MNSVASKKQETQEATPVADSAIVPTPTVIGWQGVRFVLPPDWSISGFSMDRDNGYLRVDAPGNIEMTVQVRWSKPTKIGTRQITLFSLAMTQLQRYFLKETTPESLGRTLEETLKRLFNESEKQAKKAKVKFTGTSEQETREGTNSERVAIGFEWSGVGRGIGKIWKCTHCGRIVVAQVVGRTKDRSRINEVARQLLATIHDHSEDGFDLWALYDLQVALPEDYRLLEQKLLSGYLHLKFARRSERVLVDRWGLANMTLKKFTLEDWFQNNALMSLKHLEKTDVDSPNGHSLLQFSGRLSLLQWLRSFQETLTRFHRMPSRYVGCIWQCEQTNRIFAVQTITHKNSENLLNEIVSRSHCHYTGHERMSD